MSEPYTLAELDAELDDIDSQLDALLEQLTQAYIAVQNVGAFDGGYLGFDDGRLSGCLVSARDEIEDAMQMVEDAKRRKEEGRF